MFIVIPMSGFGERFRRAGYQVPKPLIEVEGKPIIAHVIDMYPGEHQFLFICNQDHLDNPDYRMREQLEHYAPTGKIVGIPPHRLGPVGAVLEAADHIPDDEPVIVNYCDFTCDWDYPYFKQWLSEVKPDGCIPAYRGFHPHSLGSTFYAYIRDDSMVVRDIQEKQPYTDNPMQEFASSGTYYYASGAMAKAYFQRTIDEEWLVNNEYYASMTYKPMLNDGKFIAVFEIPHFMQWGTPQDLQEYEYWSNTFRGLMRAKSSASHPGSLVLPLAGLGSRFTKEGFEQVKPLIPVSGEAMLMQAVHDLPAMENQVFVLRKDLPGREAIEATIRAHHPNCRLVYAEELTEGQACTCLLAAPHVDPDAPMLIGACDNGVVYDEAAYETLLADDSVDVIAWGVSGYPYAVRSPQMYGWVDCDDQGVIRHVSVKKPLDKPETDPVILGTFTFKRASDFTRCVETLMERDERVNGEFYVDSCINVALDLGLNCKVLNVDAFLSWGTPNEWRIFNYWQACFHHWAGHPYRLENDPHVGADSVASLTDSTSPLKSAQPVREEV